jgi:hypothetical protein
MKKNKAKQKEVQNDDEETSCQKKAAPNLRPKHYRPKCGTLISPDDETEEVYKILDTKVVGDELAELVISCGTCGTIVKLTGFQQIMEA